MHLVSMQIIGVNMGETLIKKINTEYRLVNGPHHIHATVNYENGTLTIVPGNHSEQFLFRNSKPEMVYAIGTLIRDAADLVGSE